MAGGIAVLSISAFFLAAFVAVGVATEFHPVTGIAPAAVALGGVAALWSLRGLGIGDRRFLGGFLVVLVFITEGNFRVREWDDFSLDWQILMKLFTWVAAGGLILLYPASLKRLLLYKRSLPLLLLALLVLVSCVYSPTPFYSLAAAVSFLSLVAFAQVIVDHLTEAEIVDHMAVGLGVIVFVSLAIAPFASGLVDPGTLSIAESDRLHGLVGHPNQLAMVSGLFIGAMIHRLSRTGFRFWLLAAIAGAVVVLLLTQSRTPALALILSLAAAGVIYSRQRLVLILAGVSLVFLLAMLLLILPDVIRTSGVAALLSRSGDPTEVLTLTGRNQIWLFVLARIAEAPILGYGFASGRVVLLGEFGGWSLVHAHNMFLQLGLYLGLSGIGLFLAIVVTQLHAFLFRHRLAVGFMTVYVLVIGMTEQSVWANTPTALLLAWMLAVLAPPVRPVIVPAPTSRAEGRLHEQPTERPFDRYA